LISRDSWDFLYSRRGTIDSSIEALLLTLYLRLAVNERKISVTVILSPLWN